ncbi:hypothetical protein QOT17_008930 [Balamuthia mandrillaris]
MWRMRKGWHYMVILLVGFAFFTFQLLRVRSYYVEIKKEKESLEGQVAMLKNEQEAEGGMDLLLSPWKALQFFNEKKRFIGEEEEEEKDEEPEDAQRRSFFDFFAGWDADKRTFETYSRNTIPRAMLTRPHHKKHIKAWYVGWPGHNNLGDDLSFSLCRLFLDQLLFSLNRNRSSSPSSSSSTPPVMLTIEYLVPDLAKADAKRERPPEDIDLIILGGGTLISEFYLNFMQQYLMATTMSESDAAVPLLLWGTGWAETASGLLESASFASAKRLSYLLSIRGQQEEAEEKEERRKADTEDEGDGVNEGQQQQLMTVVKQEEVEELMTYLYGRRNKRPTGFLWETTEMDGEGEKGKADSTPAIRPVFGGVRGPFTRAMLDWLLPSPRQVKVLHDVVALANEFTYFFELEAEELEADVETLPDIMSTLSAPSPPAYLEQQTAGSSNPLSSHLADALQYFGIMDGVGTALSPQDSYILISWSSRSISYGGRKTFRQVERSVSFTTFFFLSVLMTTIGFRVLAETALELSKEHWVIFYLVDSSDFLSLKHILKEVHQQQQQEPPPSTPLPRLQRIVFLEASVEEEETLYLMALLKHAKCSIATKLYTAYLSIAAEVPFVSLSYNFKGMELMHTMGLERWNLSWPELDSKEVLLRLIRDLVGKNHHYKFMQKVQEFKQRTREQLRGVLQEELAHWLN